MLKRIVLSVHVFLIILSALTVQADDVSIKNPSEYPLHFRVVISSTGFDKTVILQPGETQNAIGTDLWHNAEVQIIKLASYPDIKPCGLLISERMMPSSEDHPFPVPARFYLPVVEGLPPYPECRYYSNVPNCGCFLNWESMDDGCFDECTGTSNAQVVVGAKSFSSLLHHGENSFGQ